MPLAALGEIAPMSSVSSCGERKRGKGVRRTEIEKTPCRSRCRGDATTSGRAEREMSLCRPQEGGAIRSLTENSHFTYSERECDDRALGPIIFFVENMGRRERREKKILSTGGGSYDGNESERGRRALGASPYGREGGKRRGENLSAAR